MHHAAPAKRHHSQISMPPSSSSNASTHQTNRRNHHPFENFMHMFGTALHRPSRQQRQTAQQQHHHQTAARQSSFRAAAGDELAMRPAREPKQPRQARQAAPSADDNNDRTRPEYVAPAVRSGDVTTAATAVRPKLQTVKVSPNQPAASSRPPPTAASAASAWRTAVCPRSQKPYYWNVHTRESRWKKPLELASEEEREAIRSKERKQREFFESMERNILRRLEGGRSAASGNAGKVDENAAENALESAKNAAMDGNLSPVTVTADGDEVCDGIDQSWMQVTTTANSDKINEDWITGWITPGSDANTPERGPSPSCGSLSSIEGLSVLDPNIGFSPGALSTSLTSFASLGSLSREERDDKVLPLKPPMSKLERIKSASSKPVIDKPDLIRTISKMEYDLIYQLNPSLRLPTTRANNPRATPRVLQKKRRDDEPTTPTTQTCDILSSLHLTLDSEGLNVSLIGGMASSAIPITPTSPLTPPFSDDDDDDLPMRSLSSPTSADGNVVRPSLAKRNTCGTIYLGSTLSAPDKDALIKCVCGVYRAHLLQTQTAAHASNVMFTHTHDTNETNLIFHDRRAPGDYRHLDTSSIPSLSDVTDFYRSIFLRSQMEVDCIIISLIYIERLIKMSGGALAPRANNWRSVLFSCMVLASKVWDDLSMWNCDFSKIGPSGVIFSLARTNELEVALLHALEYRVKVNASEYAKYYFLLRGMLCRSGLANDDLTRLRPLDVEGARTLEGAGVEGKVAKASMKERSKSYGHVEMVVEKGSSESSEDATVGGAALPPQSSPSSKRVTLEQIVRM